MKKKSRIKTYVIVAVLLIITMILALLPTLTGGNASDEDAVSILQTNVQRRDIDQVVSAGGSLTAQEAETLSIPEGVDITELLVENGDQISAGDVIARVDKVSVMSAVTQVQDALNELNEACAELQPDIEDGALYVSAEGEIFVDGDEIESSEYEVYSEYLSLKEEHRVYEEVMLELFQLYQNPEIVASCDGVVYGLDDSMVKELSSDGGFSVVLLSNAPDGNDAAAYTNYVGMVESISDGVMYMKMNPSPMEVEDYGNLSGVNLNTSAMTDNGTCSASIPVYYYSGSAWERLGTVQRGDILLIASNENGVVWAVKAGRTELAEPEAPTDPEEPEDPDEPTEPEAPTEPDKPTEPETPTEPDEPTKPEAPTEPGAGGEGQGGYPSGGQGGYPSGGNSISQGGYSGAEYAGGGTMGDYSMNGGNQAEAESELYATTHVTVCGITPQKTMTMSVNVDEQDISSITTGLDAVITLDAMPGQQFTGTVSRVYQIGTNGGGSSKFRVEIELPYEEGMLPGMNAGVVIVLDTVPDTLVVPVAALTDEDGKTYVYTGYDEKNETFTGKTEVSIGVSDGEYAQITDGLAEDTEIWYSYYAIQSLPVSLEGGV